MRVRGKVLAPGVVAAVVMGVMMALAPIGEARAQLMVTDSRNDRVMLFSAADGTLLTPNWITDAGAVGWSFSTPKEARVIGEEIWVTDQVADAIRRFDMERNYVGSITRHYNTGAVLDNVRGMGTDGTYVYVAVLTSDVRDKGIVVYDYAGTPVDFYLGTGSYFDAEPLMGNGGGGGGGGGGDLLVSNSASDSVERWRDGAMVGTFAAGMTFPQQITVEPDGSVIVLATIAPASEQGIFHYNADGSPRAFIPLMPLTAEFGEAVPRGAVVLGDGSYFVTTNIGVFKTVGSPVTGFVRIVGNVDAQHVAAMPGGGGPVCPCDWDGNGAIDSRDFLGYLAAFFGVTGREADYNKDGVINSQDFFDFLDCFFAGC